MSTKNRFMDFFVAPIIFAILIADCTYAASSKGETTVSGKVTINTPSCGNQPQIAGSCASERQVAGDTKLNFHNTETGLEFQIRTDHSGLFKLALPPGAYLIILDDNSLVQSISPSQINIQNKEMKRIDFTITEKVQ